MWCKIKTDKIIIYSYIKYNIKKIKTYKYLGKLESKTISVSSLKIKTNIG